MIQDLSNQYNTLRDTLKEKMLDEKKTILEQIADTKANGKCALCDIKLGKILYADNKSTVKKQNNMSCSSFKIFSNINGYIKHMFSCNLESPPTDDLIVNKICGHCLALLHRYPYPKDLNNNKYSNLDMQSYDIPLGLSESIVFYPEKTDIKIFKSSMNRKISAFNMKKLIKKQLIYKLNIIEEQIMANQYSYTFHISQNEIEEAMYFEQLLIWLVEKKKDLLIKLSEIQ